MKCCVKGKDMERTLQPDGSQHLVCSSCGKVVRLLPDVSGYRPFEPPKPTTLDVMRERAAKILKNVPDMPLT